MIVRATVALNLSCSPEVDAILAGDQDERVRALLGSRIARLLPDLDGPEQECAARHVRSTLAALANDQATRVRAAVADEIAAMEGAPRDLVLHLAKDAANEVSDQIVRLSPVLTDADLLAILATPPSPTAMTSVANRNRLSAVVADAVVQQADAPTIRALLANHSACIREATLDALVGRAPHHTDWHAPLVRRPLLSAKAIHALCEFIAADLLRVLAARADLDPAKLELVRRRLASEALDGEEAAFAGAQRLQARGQLTEQAVEAAARAGDSRTVLALLAVASNVSLRTMNRILELRSAKALVSLVWRSGFSMGLAATVQTMLAQFDPGTILHPTQTGGFPLTDEEMGWQVELMADADPPVPAFQPSLAMHQSEARA